MSNTGASKAQKESVVTAKRPQGGGAGAKRTVVGGTVPPQSGMSPGRPAGPRTVRLTMGRLDPWSTMKISFLLSVALGISLVITVAVLWLILQAMGVFDDVGAFIS
ncbi:MAG: DUF3566 domain-containing protein, partial [Angustibacter sp.]